MLLSAFLLLVRMEQAHLTATLCYGDVHKNAKVVVTYNGETLISKKRPRLAPGEMENVIIKSDMLKNFDENGIIEIQVEE